MYLGEKIKSSSFQLQFLGITSVIWTTKELGWMSMTDQNYT